MTESKALVWIRKSEGDDNDIGLQLQREKLPQQAEEIADDYDVLDLGIHTGYSRLSKSTLPNKDQFIDQHPEVQDAINRIEDGEYDAIVAWDDTRISRDGFLEKIRMAAVVGDAEIQYAGEVAEEGMARDINRAVERHVKLQEARKAIEAKNEREDRGLPDGRPPHGLRYNADSTELVPDPEEIEDVEDVFQMRESGASWREIGEETGVSKDTARRIYVENRDQYSKFLPSI